MLYGELVAVKDSTSSAAAITIVRFIIPEGTLSLAYSECSGRKYFRGWKLSQVRNFQVRYVRKQKVIVTVWWCPEMLQGNTWTAGERSGEYPLNIPIRPAPTTALPVFPVKRHSFRA